MNNIWETEEERKRREQQVGTPMEVAPYKNPEAAPPPVNAKGQPDPLTQLGTMYVSGKAVQGVDKGVEKGYDYIGKQIDAAKQPSPLSGEAPMGEVAQTGLMEPTAADVAAFSTPAAPLGTAATDTAAQNIADLAMAELSPTAGMVTSEAIAPLATEALAGAATDAAVTGVTEAALVGAPLSAAATGGATAAAGAAEAGTLAAMGPVGWAIGGALLAKQLGIF